MDGCDDGANDSIRLKDDKKLIFFILSFVRSFIRSSSSIGSDL